MGGTGAANHLDDYEEGTFTPSYTLLTTDFDAVTYDVRVGNYVKIGNVVYCTIRLRTDSITVGSGSGDAVISGLPFAATSNATAMKPGTATAWTEVPGTVRVENGQTYAGLLDENTPTGAGSSIIKRLTSAAFNTGGNANWLVIQFFYFTS